MWKLWAFLFDVEVKASEDKALSHTKLLKDPIMIPNAFPLTMFDHHKCTITKVQILTKHDLLATKNIPQPSRTASVHISSVYVNRMLLLLARGRCFGSIKQCGFL
jgi:hypothetical protein